MKSGVFEQETGVGSQEKRPGRGGVQKDMTNKEWLLERLQWEDWERFLGHTVRYAQKQIKRRRGASGNGMVLPGGHDANSVASEVVSRVLSGEARLAIGWTVERFKAELERQVNQERGG